MSFAFLEKKVIDWGIQPSHRLHMLLWYFELGAWLKKHPCKVYLNNREELYKYVNTFIKNAPICYLEFGVEKGRSMNKWLQINNNYNSQFFGFDTFTGLPEKWATFVRTLPAGTFDTKERKPCIHDKRVRFIKGLFQMSLPKFFLSFKTNLRIIVHLDADLYSSTLYGLCKIDPYLKTGSILIFDDFTTANHDFRAFYDYSTAFNRNYKVLAISKPSYRKIAIMIL